MNHFRRTASTNGSNARYLHAALCCIAGREGVAWDVVGYRQCCALQRYATTTVVLEVG